MTRKTWKAIALILIVSSVAWNAIQRSKPANHIDDFFMILGALGAIIFLFIGLAEIKERYE